MEDDSEDDVAVGGAIDPALLQLSRRAQKKQEAEKRRQKEKRKKGKDAAAEKGAGGAALGLLDDGEEFEEVCACVVNSC